MRTVQCSQHCIMQLAKVGRSLLQHGILVVGIPRINILLLTGVTKSGHDGEMTFHPDKEGFGIDQFHSLACYLITAGGDYTQAAMNPDGPSCMFPSFYKWQMVVHHPKHQEL